MPPEIEPIHTISGQQFSLSFWASTAAAAPRLSETTAEATEQSPTLRAKARPIPPPPSNTVRACTHLVAAIGAAFGGPGLSNVPSDPWHADICRKYQSGHCNYDRHCSHFHPGLDPVHVRPTSAERASYSRLRSDLRHARHGHNQSVTGAAVSSGQDHACLDLSASATGAKPSRASRFAGQRAPYGHTASSSSRTASRPSRDPHLSQAVAKVALANDPPHQCTDGEIGRRVRRRRGTSHPRGPAAGWLQHGIPCPALDLAGLHSGYSASHAAANPLTFDECEASKAISTLLRDWKLLQFWHIEFTPEGFVDARDLQDWSARRNHAHAALKRCILASRSERCNHGRFELAMNTTSLVLWVRASPLRTTHTDGTVSESTETADYPANWPQGPAAASAPAPDVDFEEQAHVDLLATVRKACPTSSASIDAEAQAESLGQAHADALSAAVVRTTLGDGSFIGYENNPTDINFTAAASAYRATIHEHTPTPDRVPVASGVIADESARCQLCHEWSGHPLSRCVTCDTWACALCSAALVTGRLCNECTSGDQQSASLKEPPSNFRSPPPQRPTSGPPGSGAPRRCQLCHEGGGHPLSRCLTCNSWACAPCSAALVTGRLCNECTGSDQQSAPLEQPLSN